MESTPPSPTMPPEEVLPSKQDSASEAIAAVLDELPFPDSTPAAVPAQPPMNRRQYNKKQKHADRLIAYTSAFVPGMYNVKNPAGEYVQREINLDVARQVSQARKRRKKAEEEEEKQRLQAEGQPLAAVNPLSNILIIHPGSKNLRIGRASDFYPKEVPNCIARPKKKLESRTSPSPEPSAKRSAETPDQRETKRQRNGHARKTNGDDEAAEDPMDKKIGYLREYLRGHLVANRLATDWREGNRVVTYNQKVKPEPVPEHNDPYRIDWTEVGERGYLVGEEALQLPPDSGFDVKYPILHRGLNTEDWSSLRHLLDDVVLILQEALRTELNIFPRDYQARHTLFNFAVVLIVPDHGDRTYPQEISRLLMREMGFREIAIHQEAYCAIFSAGMSSACVVDIGATSTSVTCVDEGQVSSETRIMLDYGGDDVTKALTTILQRSAFPFKDLDLSRSQDWKMMDNLKIKICTLEEHLVASTLWDFYVLHPKNLTQKYVFRTYDENILAPLCFFDTRMVILAPFLLNKANEKIAFSDDSQKPPSKLSNVDDLLYTLLPGSECSYQPTTAMKSCVSHLIPIITLPPPISPPLIAETPPRPIPANEDTTNEVLTEELQINGDLPSVPPISDIAKLDKAEGSLTSTPVPEPAPLQQATELDFSAISSKLIISEASHTPLDGAIAASILAVGTDSKIRTASSSILLIGGGSAMKGLHPFIQER
ncbi:hypothetical protein TREMEDRAFT_62486 [Tremella mesenterica DSM 1558]|uniref:uncharacterized protein n=1 Tax=Tremella mesenterica (strain ATCC 24925 / CBS 8224 / DSM 1558 / NBRC 9311 / NRRL Y-6157 / RJB 2259-6 / UBC 559-6) TaxID=578456 RepID=UPI0003F48C1B|nr:uncharacterized protein TREMEDRAFT_62486 [Tremella mesenterica DSM 1558]EIW69617.1 hypothetical protein TREMEDRAFT_62486 [Tremella mesenterica DSM 1558]